MTLLELKNSWKQEEEKAFKGWDFSYLHNRTKEQELPWDYRSTVLSYMGSANRLLDMGTGGGEFLLSLSPPKGRTYATEAYPPNYELCKLKLPQYGIDIKQVIDDDYLPFESDFFDLVINRHESYSVQELSRIIQPGGLFITQQVGGQNNRDLARYLLDSESKEVDAGFDLKSSKQELERAGFTILEEGECFPSLTFFDIGALVYFAKIIEWEFPGFTVERCFDKLCSLHDQIERAGFIQSKEHRFYMIARKEK